MGTRAAYGFRHKKQDYISYNHSDGYPNGLGYEVLEALTSFTLTKDIAHLRACVENVKLISKEDNHTFSKEDFLSVVERLDNLGIYNNLKSEYSSITEIPAIPVIYHTAGKVDTVIDRENAIPYMLDSCNFMNDSLFCEWAYVINLDEQVVEFYRGFNQNPEAKGRYAAKKRDYGSTEYNGVALIGTVPFAVIDSWTKDDLADFTMNLERFANFIVGKYNVEESYKNVKQEVIDKAIADLSSIKDIVLDDE